MNTFNILSLTSYHLTSYFISGIPELSINASKTKIVLFKGKNKSQNQQISLRINNNIIKQVSSVRFLGLIIDEGLTWKEHIDSVSKNIIKSSGLIAKLRHYANKNSLKLIYYALVYPYLTYGNLVWGNTYPTRLKKLFNIQKKIVRLICFKLYTDHSEPLFFNLKILNVYKINDYLCSLFMYRYNYGKKLPDLYINYFKQNKEVHNYNTRNRNKLHVSYKRTDYRKYTVFSKGISIWNCLDETIRNIKSFFSFKNKVKFYYLENNC